MPFTPFHMGVAMLAKPVAKDRFSVLAFGLSQIAMDIEPLVGMLSGRVVLHGWSHTVVGALVIGSAVAVTAPPLLRRMVKLLYGEARTHGMSWIMDSTPPTHTAIWSGAILGTLSHVFLDGFMHDDMRPWAPFSQAESWLGFVGHDTMYILCAAAFVVGASVWMVDRWRRRERH